MLATDKISKAFVAIVEEAEKLRSKDLSEKSLKRVNNIISIAKHQSDVRDSKKGSCCGSSKGAHSCHKKK